MNRTIRVGKKNSIFQHVETLKRNRTKRFACKEFVVEGVANINNAINNGWVVKHFIYSDYEKLSNWAKEKIAKFDIENWEFEKELMQEISEKTDTSELIAIFEMKDVLIKQSKNPLIVIFDTPSKKGNLGTVIRSADAFACDGVIITGHAVDIYDPAVISSSMGSFFNVPIIKIDTNDEVLGFINKLKLKYKDLAVVATTLDAEKQICENDFTKPTVLLIGNETNGLSKFFLENCDSKVKIEMTKDVESLNVSCAASIVLYEIQRQRKG